MARLPKAPAARVRMYRQGLGDCFLIALPRDDGGTFHLLIDCGVLAGTPDAEATMDRVARDVAATTGGHLDVVVVTHEHWDHLSGFLQARRVFDDLTIGEVWLPWTEDPADATAEMLRRVRRRVLRGLRTAAGRMAVGRSRGPLAFFGADSGLDTRAAIEYLIEHPSSPRVRYLGPDRSPLDLPGVSGVRVYVLGPPREAGTLPGRTAVGLAAGVALLSVVGGSMDDDEETALGQAFESRYRLSPGRAEGMPFFRDHYSRPEDSWRRIDADWLGATEPLALALDEHTNDTSLALAIELEPGGRVLLFPGDAQLGQWSSWGNLRWRPVPPPARSITAADLLARTVLYKVSHHGGPGGTPLAGGLGLMTSPDLVALVPVDHATAERMGWDLPSATLLDRLRRQARGRVLRSDAGMPDHPDDVTASGWASFRDRAHVDPDGLFIDYLP